MLQLIKKKVNEILTDPYRFKMRKSGFDHTDIVKFNGEFFHFSKSTPVIEDFNVKCMKIRKSDGKDYGFLKIQIPLLHQLLRTFFGQQSKNFVGKHYNL